MFNPWFLPSLPTFVNRGLDLMLRTVSDDPDERARSLVCCAPMVRDHYLNKRVQSAADGRRATSRPRWCKRFGCAAERDRTERMAAATGSESAECYTRGARERSRDTRQRETLRRTDGLRAREHTRIHHRTADGKMMDVVE